MSYRDDLTAAHDRIRALEAELAWRPSRWTYYAAAIQEAVSLTVLLALMALAMWGR